MRNAYVPQTMRRVSLSWYLVMCAFATSCDHGPKVSGEASAPEQHIAVTTGLTPRSQPAGASMFTRLETSRTGIDFVHDWMPPDRYPHDLETAMVGGGVAIGDVDGDELPDIYLSRPYGGNRLYRNLGDFRFQDITERAGVADDSFWGGGVTLVDVDNDTDLDIYACGHDCANRLFINQGDGTFLERAEAFGLNYRGASVMMAFADIDRDGDLDAYLLTNRLNPPDSFQAGRAALVNGQWIVPPAAREYRKILVHPNGTPIPVDAAQYDHLYRNEGHNGNGQIRFQDISEEAGITGNDHGLAAVWWDYNRDGWPDLYVANDFTDPDRLYRNNGDGTFADVLPETVPHTPWFSMGVDIADINNDQRCDLLATDMAGSNHYKQKVAMGEMSDQLWFLDYPVPRQYMRNALYLNTGTDRFMEVAFLAGLANTDWTWAVRLDDFDNDGWVDLFVTNGMTRDWQNSDLKAKVEQLGGKMSPAGKAFWMKQLPKTEANLAFRNRGDCHFENTSRAWGLDHVGVSFGAATGDLDRDGDLDLVVNNFQQPAAVYRNDAQGNRLTVELQGKSSNRWGIGAQVDISSVSTRQVRYLTLSRGFMSSSQPIVHFGLGTDEVVQQLTIHWPSGLSQRLDGLRANCSYKIVEPQEQRQSNDAPRSAAPLFRDHPLLSAAEHRERPHDDFAQQPLLPNRLSQLGPGIACGDIDGDGDDDVFLSGAAGQAGMMMLNLDGRFALSPDSSTPHGAFTLDSSFEDMGAAFLDADTDGDLDLYCVSGGVETHKGHELLQDRLYMNDGRGRFIRAPDGVLPSIRDSGSVVAAADFDRDGDVDLFVGGRVIPGEYPMTPASYLLRNDSDDSRVLFTDVTEQVAPGLRRTGLVTGAIWSDSNGDDWLDLLIAHEWGPIKCFRNARGSHFDDSPALQSSRYRGWWNAIAGGDLDNDGDIDYVATNFGLNTKYHATSDQPHVLYYGDVDGSGRNHIIEAEFEGDTLYPVRGRSCSTNAVPVLRQRFHSFHDFAIASLDEIYAPDRLAKSRRFEITTLQCGALMNEGDHFSFRPLPHLGQAAPSFGVAIIHANDDTFADLLLVQNFFGPQPETGRMDGGVGMLLTGDGTGRFSPVAPEDSGIVIPQDAKSLALADLNHDGMPSLIVGVNNGPPRVLERNPERLPRGLYTVRLRGPEGNPMATGSRITVTTINDKSYVAEIHGGSGYLSQSSPVATFCLGEEPIKMIAVRWPDGARSRHAHDGALKILISYPATAD